VLLSPELAPKPEQIALIQQPSGSWLSLPLFFHMSFGLKQHLGPLALNSNQPSWQSIPYQVADVPCLLTPQEVIALCVPLMSPALVSTLLLQNFISRSISLPNFHSPFSHSTMCSVAFVIPLSILIWYICPFLDIQ